VAAALLARRGWRVLLVERSPWPREKACGGCVNAAAVALLRAAGLGDVLAGAADLGAMALHAGARVLQIALPAGVAMDRRELDARLVARAVAEGAVFWPQTLARLDPLLNPGPRVVRFLRAGINEVARAQVVLACDGLRGGLLAEEPWARWTMAQPARLGFAATVEAGVTPPGVLEMCIGRAGYVGLVRLADGRTHVGAALWPGACHARGGPRGVIQQILAQCRQPPIAELDGIRFLGTGPLTARRAAVAGPRVLAIGDACGYVEPFTGEGISWAIRGAVAAAGVLPARADGWHDGLMGAWQDRHASAVGHRQRWCRRLRGVLRRPLLAAGCLAAARCWPGMPARLARRICA